MENPMSLAGKQILVYESGNSLDKVITERLLGLGATLSFIQELKPERLELCITALVREKGPFDGFVFTLTHSVFRPLQFVKHELVNSILQENYGLFVEAMRVLKKSRGLNDMASIVALSSISSIRAMKAKLAFCSAKAALDATVKCLAVELAEKGIRINSVQKGIVDVDYEKEHIQDIVAINDSIVERKALLGVTKALEIANTVAFLLSDATTTMTGSSIVIDGGYSL